MNKKRIMETLLFIFVSFVFIENSLSWEGIPTHKDLTDYASENSVLHKDKGDYLKHLGFKNGFEEYFKWNKRRTVKEWLQEGSALEDEWWGWGDTLTGFRCRNHFHNPLKDKDGGQWGEWDSAGLDDLFSGMPALLWAQDRTKQSAYPEGDWTWQEARDRYYLALTLNTNAERQENFARTFRALGHQMHLVQDMAVPAHVRNDAHPLRFNKAGGLHIEKWAAEERNIATVNSFATSPDFPSLDLNKDITYNSEKLVPITQFTDIDEYDGSNPSTSLSIGLAEYTNANFFSDDTIFSEDCPINDRHHFPYPKKSDTNVQSLIDQELIPETNTVTGDTEFHISRVDDEGHSIINNFVQPTYHTNDMAESGVYYRSFYLSENCHKDYAEHLIPHAVGYSAGLINYFFRGNLSISSPDGFVYSIIDGTNTAIINDDEHQIFTHIKAKVRNTTPDEDIQNGTIQAVAKYRIMEDYEKDLSNYPQSTDELKTMMENVSFSYSVSQATQIQSLSPTNATELTFDFTNDPIPCGITDLYLFVVFKGTLGNEQDTAIAVGMKDLNEPQHLTFWNDTDYFLLNGVPVKADDIRDDPDVEDYGYINPFSFNEVVAFSALSYTGDPLVSITVDSLPPARYTRIILLADDPNGYQVTDHIEAYGETDPIIDATYEYSLPGFVNQQMPDGSWENTPVYSSRGITQHQRTYFMNYYPYFVYINDLPAPPENTQGPYPVP